ncbi:enhancer of yellow 2 transcription factor [Uranotaenia lowii]|uniref:enhancer of yellow 2 transcription factor n=1 Tax=Uranotaenia lowii TaxID=190385 RepID=UPI002478A096|nr:enhancer of yellow 2 transcription factor [Uranotaenia lowii]XP_055596362.1 enhancer of yellow 2 transcription factor [Uranotaenia lowii]XP_055596364.1 enhancer of yellow 2 transcription factor [Uranotaenia lowii]
MTFTKSVDQITILQGDRTKLKDLLRNRLNACGWSDQVRLLCREAIKEQDNAVNCDALIQQVTPKARALIPDTVKKELLQKIKTILIQQEGIDI